MPPRPVVIPPPAVEIQPLSPDLDRPRPPVKSTPIELKPPPDAGGRRRLIRLGAAGLLIVMLAGVLGVGIRWLAGPRKKQDATAAEKALESRKDAIRAAFTAPALKRFAEQHAKWEIAPSDAARSRGKIIVLSWTEAGQAPGRVSDNDLIKAILERGRVDDFSFDLPEEFWAEAPADAGTMVGIRWSSEVGGVFRDGKLVDLAGHPPSGDTDTPAVRWRATAIVLDTATSRLTARHEFVGPLPTRAPAVGKKEAIGPRPVEEVGEWLKRLLTGPGKTARGPAPSP